jgi:hypothetical protein
MFRFGTTGPAAEKNVEISEMVIAISSGKWPDYVFVRERDRIRAFSKYHPRQAIALEEMLKNYSKTKEQREALPTVYPVLE